LLAEASGSNLEFKPTDEERDVQCRCMADMVLRIGVAKEPLEALESEELDVARVTLQCLLETFGWVAKESTVAVPAVDSRGGWGLVRVRILNEGVSNDVRHGSGHLVPEAAVHDFCRHFKGPKKQIVE